MSAPKTPQAAESEHTPLPWIAASAYSSVVGVPIVNSEGRRVGNTALPAMPKEWDELKRRAVADAALIVRAVNAHARLVKALIEAERFMAYFANETDGHFSGDGTPTTCLVEIRAALASAGVKP